MKITSKSFRSLLLSAVSLTGLLLAFSEASATVTVPFGVQQNIPFSTVTNTWGWTLTYQGTYNQTVALSTLYAGVNPGDYVMYAARPVGSSVITLLAAANEADVRTVTAWNQTTASNGAEWYYNGGSIGFAGAGLTIHQNNADVNSSGLYGGTSDGNGSTRLTWHTSGGYGNAPTSVNGGWRAGETVELNSSTDWERLVFVASPIPEPTAAVLPGLALLGLASRRRRC